MKPDLGWNDDMKTFMGVERHSLLMGTGISWDFAYKRICDRTLMGLSTAFFYIRAKTT